MRSSLALLTFAAALVSAQAQNYTSELDMTIDPGTVPQQTRATWCQAQTNTCELLCGNDTGDNSCTESDLSWECTCSSNSSAPGLQYYTQTVPTFICNELFSQCITSNANSQRGQESCTDNIHDLCGTVNPPKNAITDGGESTTAGTATTAAATESGTSSATGTADSVTSTSSDGLAAPTMVPAGKGAAALAIGILAYLV
ncbi:Fc.00g067930.m01.CDS01 [Cosmosporella sp. VM-42]